MAQVPGTRQGILNGVHQAIGKINYNLHQILPGLWDDAVFLRLGQSKAAQAKGAAVEIHGANVITDWSLKAGPNGKIGCSVGSEAGHTDLVDRVIEVFDKDWNRSLHRLL